MKVILFIIFLPIALPLWLLWNLLAFIGKILFLGDIFKKWSLNEKVIASTNLQINP